MILMLICDEDYQNVYELVWVYGMECGVDFVDVEFMFGWLVFVYLDDVQVVMVYFIILCNNVLIIVLVFCVVYWMVCVVDVLGDFNLVVQYYVEVGEYLMVYYGQLVIVQIVGDQVVLDFVVDFVLIDEICVCFENCLMIQVMCWLGEQGEDYYYWLFSYCVDDLLMDLEEVVLLVELVNDYFYVCQLVCVVKVVCQCGVVLL